MRIAALGSGSRGNSVLIEHADTCIMVDCGFSTRETERRLANLGKEAGQLTGIFVSHEHSDHVRGIGSLARKYQIPVWMTQGTRSACKNLDTVDVRLIQDYAAIEVQDLMVQPYAMPHDANEPCQFVFSNGQKKAGVLTDIGSITPTVIDALDGCDALMLECNHDTDMLDQSEYPYFLKERITGDFGHFSNEQAVSLLEQIDIGGLQHIVALHLSEKNNTPSLVRSSLSESLNCEPDWIEIAEQHNETQWRSLV